MNNEQIGQTERNMLVQFDFICSELECSRGNESRDTSEVFQKLLVNACQLVAVPGFSQSSLLIFRPPISPRFACAGFRLPRYFHWRVQGTVHFWILSMCRLNQIVHSKRKQRAFQQIQSQASILAEATGARRPSRSRGEASEAQQGQRFKRVRLPRASQRIFGIS
jgi:hypothetical protein